MTAEYDDRRGNLFDVDLKPDGTANTLVCTACGIFMRAGASTGRLTAASNCRSKRFNRLGHSTLEMTADTYGHLFPRGDDRERNGIGANVAAWGLNNFTEGRSQA
jgi:hypothetical protein